jgi:hypothetical protein
MRKRSCTPRSGPCPAAGTGRHLRLRDRARPSRDPHPEGRPRQPPGLPRLPPGHQDHPLAAGRRRRPDHPPDRLRHHQPDQRPRHRPGPGPPRPRALVHRGTPPPRPRRGLRRRRRHQPHRQRAANLAPSAPPSSRPSKRPATCTSPKAGATIPLPPKPFASTASIRTEADIHGTRRSPAHSPRANDWAKLASPWARISLRTRSVAGIIEPPASWRRSGAGRESRPRAGRSVRARRRPPRRWVSHRGWRGRPVRCRCVPGRQCRRSPPARSWRAARPRSALVARRPRLRVVGSPAIGANVIPRGRQAVAGRADKHRKPGRDRRGAGGRGLGLVPAGRRAGARSPAPRDPRIRPQSRIVPSQSNGASIQESGAGKLVAGELAGPEPHRNPARAGGYCSSSSVA